MWAGQGKVGQCGQGRWGGMGQGGVGSGRAVEAGAEGMGGACATGVCSKAPHNCKSVVLNVIFALFRRCCSGHAVDARSEGGGHDAAHDR